MYTSHFSGDSCHMWTEHSNPSRISLIVIDDDRLVAAAVALLCSTLNGVDVLGYASSGREGLALIEKSRPSVALVDLTMEDLNGVDLTADVRKRRISTPIIILTGNSDE